MIAFSRVSKQYGRQVLFVDTSFQLNPGEKVGLVGPNGAGKTTLFRMITGEETPDEGDVSVPKKLDRWLLSTGRRGDVRPQRARRGDCRQRPRRRRCTTSSRSCNQAMSDPDRADDMDKILARFGEVQEEYEHLGGYALESQAREVLHGLGFDDERIDGDVGALSGGWKMRVAMARVLLGRPDVLLLDEPTNHLDIESIIWLEDFLKSLPGALLMTSHDRDFMNRIVNRIAEIDSGEITRLLWQLRLLRARARHPRSEPRGGVRAAAGDAGQGTALHRALRRACGQGGAGAEPRQGARQDREDRAAEEAAGRRLRLSQAARVRAIRLPCSRMCRRRTAGASFTTAST